MCYQRKTKATECADSITAEYNYEYDASWQTVDTGIAY